MSMRKQHYILLLLLGPFWLHLSGGPIHCSAAHIGLPKVSFTGIRHRGVTESQARQCQRPSFSYRPSCLYLIVKCLCHAFICHCARSRPALQNMCLEKLSESIHQGDFLVTRHVLFIFQLSNSSRRFKRSGYCSVFTTASQRVNVCD